MNRQVFFLKQVQVVVCHPSKRQKGGGYHHAPHGQIPTPFAEEVHGKQIERKCDDKAGAFAEIGREALPTRTAKRSEELEYVENKNGSQDGQHQADEQTRPNFILVQHNLKIEGSKFRETVSKGHSEKERRAHQVL